MLKHAHAVDRLQARCATWRRLSGIFVADRRDDIHRRLWVSVNPRRRLICIIVIVTAVICTAENPVYVARRSLTQLQQEQQRLAHNATLLIAIANTADIKHQATVRHTVTPSARAVVATTRVARVKGLPAVWNAITALACGCIAVWHATRISA